MKAPTLKIGVAGVRGIAGVSLTPSIAASFAAAFGVYGGPRRIVVGADPRPSRAMLLPAVHAGLLSVGCTPVDLGVLPMPALHHGLRTLGAGGGIGVTASHHPWEWNALKFIGADGIVLRPHQFVELLDLYHQGVYPRVSHEAIPEVEPDDGAEARHVEAVLAGVDRERIAGARLHVAIDACNGAAARSAPALLAALGCRVTAVHTEIGTPFPRPPEPAVENLGDLSAAVRAAGADLGFALDADADRLAVVDARGEPLGEETTLALVARRVLQRDPGPVVVSLSTSRMADDLARAAGVPVFRTPIGEAHVVERMRDCGAAVGGEGNGGVIVPAINRCRDGLAAMALVLESMAVEDRGVAALRDALPRYATIKQGIPCRTRDAVAFLRLVREIYADRAPDTADGVKVEWPDRWLHLRLARTESVLRVTAEAAEPAAAQALVEEALDYFRPAAAP